MLHEALLVANRRANEEQEKIATQQLLDQLPIEVLKEIAQTGTFKLAFMDPVPGSSSGTNSWVDQFKGTPFFQQAIALEQEDLQSQTAQQQSDMAMRQKNDAQYAQQDQVRLKKKLLELQKARNEAQVLDGGAGPPAAAGSPDPAGTAPGTPAGPVMEELKTAAAKMKLALSAQTLGAYAKKQTDVAGLASAAKSRLGRGVQKITAGDALGGQKAVNQGNAFAQLASQRSPMAKAAMDMGLASKLKSVAGAGPKIKLKPGGNQFSARSFNAEAQSIPGSRDPFGITKKASVQAVENWAREMAQDDFAKIAHAQEVQTVGDIAGRVMAKTALDASGMAGMGGKAIEWALKNPAKAGAIAGGVGGAAIGASTGGVEGAVKGGLGGAAVGAGLAHSASHIGNAMKGGASATDALKGYGTHISEKAKSILKSPPSDPPTMTGALAG